MFYMDSINLDSLRVTELLPDSIVSLTARKGTKAYRFESSVLELSEQEDADYAGSLSGDFIIIEPIRVDDKIVKFVTEGISYYFIGNHKGKPYLFENISIEKIELPSYGVAHLLRADKEGRRFNRRDNFRVWLGQHCNIALRGIEKYNGQREDYQFTLHTLKGEIVRIVENNEKVNLVGCKITEGREEVEKFVAMKQREKNKVGRKTNDLISMFVGKEGKKE